MIVQRLFATAMRNVAYANCRLRIVPSKRAGRRLAGANQDGSLVRRGGRVSGAGYRLPDESHWVCHQDTYSWEVGKNQLRWWQAIVLPADGESEIPGKAVRGTRRRRRFEHMPGGKEMRIVRASCNPRLYDNPRTHLHDSLERFPPSLWRLAAIRSTRPVTGRSLRPEHRSQPARPQPFGAVRSKRPTRADRNCRTIARYAVFRFQSRATSADVKRQCDS